MRVVPRQPWRFPIGDDDPRVDTDAIESIRVFAHDPGRRVKDESPGVEEAELRDAVMNPVLVDAHLRTRIEQWDLFHRVLGAEGGGDASETGDVCAVGEDVALVPFTCLESVEDEAGLGFGAVEGVEGGGVGVVEGGAAVWVCLEFGCGGVLEF